MRNALSFFLFCLFLIIFISFFSCLPSPKIIPPGPDVVATYNFDYQPTDIKKSPESFTFLLLAGVPDIKSPYSTTSAVVSVEFQGSETPHYSPQTIRNINKIISAFSTALTEDVKELMTARGYRLVQLVKTQDEATFGQREMSNFAIRPVISVEIDDTITNVTSPKYELIKISPGLVEGVIGVKARISVEMKEPITWQLIWLKYVETDRFEEDYTFKWNWTSKGTSGYTGFQIGEDTRAQALASLLSGLYNEVLKKIEIYFDPQEFSMLNKQAQEIRKKAMGIVK